MLSRSHKLIKMTPARLVQEPSGPGRSAITAARGRQFTESAEILTIVSAVHHSSTPRSHMPYTRREFGQLAFASLPAAAVLGRAASIFGAFAQAKPNSVIDGVQIGTITYSYRSMPDQSAEATLKYVLDSGISANESIGSPYDRCVCAP